MSEQNDLKKVVTNGVRLAGDTLVVPGTSLILDGQLGHGVARVAAGLAARAVLGPIGWFAIAADSYAKSSTGTSLVGRIWSRARPSAAAAPSESAPADEIQVEDAREAEVVQGEQAKP